MPAYQAKIGQSYRFPCGCYGHIDKHRVKTVLATIDSHVSRCLERHHDGQQISLGNDVEVEEGDPAHLRLPEGM